MILGAICIQARLRNILGQPRLASFEEPKMGMALRLVLAAMSTFPAMQLLAACGGGFSEESALANDSIVILDESRSERSSRTSLEDLASSPFRQLVVELSDHMERQGNSPNGPTSHRDAQLFFVYRPLVALSNSSPMLPDLKARPGGCHVESPWVTMSTTSEAKPRTVAIIVLSEYQLLLDQAAMSSESAIAESPTALSNRDFDTYARDYAHSVLELATPGDEAKAAAAVSRRLPPGLFWLFRHAPQTTRGPFQDVARGALVETVKRATPGLISLIQHIVDQCLTSGPTIKRYRTIRDVTDIFDRTRYRLDSLY